MTITCYLKFSTSIGQSLYISGNTKQLGSDIYEAAHPMTYFNNDYWFTTLNLDDNAQSIIKYRFLLKDKDGLTIVEGEKDRIINFTGKDLTIIDTWNHAGDQNNCFYTQPFKNTLTHTPPNKRLSTAKKDFFEFRVKAPLLSRNQSVCISGEFNNWDTATPVLMSFDGTWHVARLDLSAQTANTKYKYGIYNTKTKTFENYEEGPDRILFKILCANAAEIIIHDGFFHANKFWKGAGVAIPVFSLRSKESFGTGEFNDLKLLVDWAKLTGLKVIQLLPINDTTANHTAQDSYPYAAISAFALNPLYINLAKVAGSDHAVLKPYNKKQKELNQLPDLDYEEVMKLKRSVLNELYLLRKSKLAKDPDYKTFIEENKDWLKAYAAFCYLRDKYNTADFSSWKNNAVFDEDAIEKLFNGKSGDEVRFHYFVQYHLHLQLKEAVDYAHKNHIILKGDIPIGVFRNGCDAWMHPELFNMDQQSGAPPDDFAVKGQNWSFPTYNWQKMQLDEFKWWKQRFQQMNRYFDAFRIDHILGFFRIWSIPLNAVEGILGRFMPAIPVYKNEFENRHIFFDHDRFCKPFITDNVLAEVFGSEAEFIRLNFLDAGNNGLYTLKEPFSNQRKIERYFNTLKEPHPDTYKQGLFNLITNVILIEDHEDPANQFHFRIAMDKTSSFANLDDYAKGQFYELYINYFFKRQDELWRREAMNKLPSLKAGTDMLICGEDLGMVPGCVPDVMRQLGILSLEIQRMPKDPGAEFFHPKDAPYMSVVTPSTHDMSTIRGWWEEDRAKTQRFYHLILGHYGEAPYFCEPWINKEIVIQHLYSPAMWSVFQLQDILGMDEKIRRPDPAAERINQPADPTHYWRYRMHIFLEQLIKEKEFNTSLRDLVTKSGRI